MSKEVLDPSCGSRMFYFDKNNPGVLYADCRTEEHILCDGRKLEIFPDKEINFLNMPFDNESFSLIVFDPPHLRTLGENSWMAKKYGKLPEKWQDFLSLAFNECWRVLKPEGTMVFKWNENEIKIRELLACLSQKPLFGHTTTINLKTHWMVFYKFNPTNPNGLKEDKT